MNARIIPPLKTHNRFHPSPTKDDIKIWANQDDNYTNAKGYPLTTYKDEHYKLAPRIERINLC